MTHRSRGRGIGVFMLSLLMLGVFSTSFAMPNPAAVYCEQQGGQFEGIASDEYPGGICVVPDGTRRDAWEYYQSRSHAVSSTSDNEVARRFATGARIGDILGTVIGPFVVVWLGILIYEHIKKQRVAKRGRKIVLWGIVLLVMNFLRLLEKYLPN